MEWISQREHSLFVRVTA